MSQVETKTKEIDMSENEAKLVEVVAREFPGNPGIKILAKFTGNKAHDTMFPEIFRRAHQVQVSIDDALVVLQESINDSEITIHNLGGGDTSVSMKDAIRMVAEGRVQLVRVAGGASKGFEVIVVGDELIGEFK